MLITLGGLGGMIAGWIFRGPREIRFRLLNKPKKMRLPVLVSPEPTPRLVPGEMPNATRASRTHAPASRQTPAGAPGSGVIHYLAAFAEPSQTSSRARIDYLLAEADSVEDSLPEPADPPTDSV